MEVFLTDDGNITDVRYTDPSMKPTPTPITNAPTPAPQSPPTPQASRPSGGGSSPLLQQQLAAQQAMFDAQASGNREKYEESRRQFQELQRLRYAEMFGFDPGFTEAPAARGGGGSAQGTPGSYQTKNGVKTTQQMREELKVAGWPEWEQANEQQVVDTYRSTTGGDVTPAGSGASGGGGGSIGAGGPNAGMGQRFKDVYERVRAKKGVAYLSANDPDLLAAAGAEFAGALTPEQISQVYEQGANYYRSNNNQVIPDQVVGQIVTQWKPFGLNPTLNTRKWVEDTRQWEADFEEKSRQFDQQEYGNMARALLQASAQMRGPRDWVKYQEMLGGGRGVLDQLHGSTPNPGFGMTGETEPARVSDILEGLGMTSRPASKRKPIPQTGARL